MEKGRKAGDSISKSIQTLTDTDGHVDMVKNGEPTGYPGITYGEAFDKFFSNPTWRYFKGVDDSEDETDDVGNEISEEDNKKDSKDKYLNVVEFTGGCSYQDTDVDVLIQFVIDDSNKQFKVECLTLNEIPQNMLVLSSLLTKVFESYPVDGKYVNLQGFIDCVSSYSDPPTGTEEEIQEYYKTQYDEWKSGNGYKNIIQNDDGEFKCIEYSEIFGDKLDEIEWDYDEYSQYALYDLDDDGIKELIVSYGESTADWINDVYKYDVDSDDIYKVGDFPNDVMLYVAEDNRGLYAVSARMGYQHIYQITLENGELNSGEIMEEYTETDDYYSNDNPVKMAYITDRSLLSQN